MKSFVVIISILGLFYANSAQNLPDANEALAKVNDVLSNIQLKDLNVTQLPIGEAESALRKKCEKNADAKAYDTAKQAGVRLFDCVKDLVNVTQLKEEIEKAKPKGDLDEVFKKYCDKQPTLKKCIYDFTAAIEPCLDKEEREKKLIVHNVTEKILDFVCFKDGDRIALFVSVHGPECFQSKTQAITNCANSTYGNLNNGSALPFNPAAPLTGVNDIKDIFSISLDKKTCENINSFQLCVVNALEQCEDPTSANLLDSIMNFLKNSISCKKILAS